MNPRLIVALLMCLAATPFGASGQMIAPVIQEFRSPIVADDDTATTPNFFVFPDALSLENQAIDPDLTVSPENIIWSYAGDGTYELNGTARLNLANPGQNPNNPGIRRLGTIDRDGAQRDNDPRTLTVRNRLLSSRFGANIHPDGDGVLATYTRPITMIASDGTTWTSKSFLAYTSKGGADRFMEPVGVVPATNPFGAGWTSVNVIPGPGGASFSASGAANGVCIQTELLTFGFGVWTSPFGELPLVKDNVYRIRINVQSMAPLVGGSTPFWDFVIDNVKVGEDGVLMTGSQGKYSLDVLNWDTNGSANSVGLSTGGRRTFDLWWAPLAVSAADWNSPSGEFTAANDAFNDGRFQFRVIDVTGRVDGNNDAGNLCLKSYEVDRFDIRDFSVTESSYNVDAPSAEFADATPGFANAGSNMTVRTIFPSTTITNSDGVTLTPSVPGAWSSFEIIEISPGDDNVDFETPATLADNWPIPWNTNELFKITAGIQAPDMQGQVNPPDTIRIMMDVPTSEISIDSLLSAGANLLGMPKNQSVTPYVAFFHTQNRTNSEFAEYQALRPRVSFMNIQPILSGGLAENSGGVTLKYLMVQKLAPME